MQEPGPVASKKKLFLKRLRTIVISIVVLLLLAIGAGVGYTWYAGQTEPSGAAMAQLPTPKKAVTTKPVAPPPNAKVGVAQESFVSPVKPGDNSSISIQTTPGSTCSITLKYGSVMSTDSGLHDKVADEYGLVSWSWTVDENAPVGTWPVAITCVRGTQSGALSVNLVVSKDAQSP